MGHEAKPYVPFLTSMFFFIFFNNIFGMIPGIQMPATARMAVPAILALLVWVVFNVAGMKAKGSALLRRRAVPARRAEGALHPGDADRVHVDVPGPAVLARRSSLRQRARRSHPARHVRRA